MSKLLLEDGDALLQEDGFFLLLDEQQGLAAGVLAEYRRSQLLMEP
jgi:hypothetical protein